MRKDYHRNLRCLLFLSLLGFTFSQAFSSYSYINNYGSGANGYQYIVLDKGYQLWACAFSENSIRVFHPNGTQSPFSPIATGKNSSGSSLNIYSPVGIAMDTNGIIYVACDNGTNHNVFKFQSWDGVALNGFEPGFKLGDLAFDSSNNLYISGNNLTDARVRFYVTNTAGVNLVGSPISVSTSTAGIYLNPGVDVKRDGSVVYLSGLSEGKIWKFTGSVSNGTANFSTAADFVTGLSSPVACDVDNVNEVFVSTTTDNSVRVYDSGGTVIQTITGMTQPHGVGIYPNSQVLLISQYGTGLPFQRWVIPPTLQIPILGYHNVTASCNFSHGLMISPDILADNLDFLMNHGYNVISLDTLAAHILDGAPLPPNPVAISFDDNYSGEVWFGAPLLTTRNMPGTIFVVTNYAGVVTGTGPHGTWSELSAADSMGVQTQSHTLNHNNLSNVAEASAFSESSSSKRAIEINLNKICKFFAYPNGADTFTSSSFSPRATIPTIEGQAGYVGSFSYAGGYSSRTTPIHNLSRVVMSGDDTLNQFKSKIGFVGSRITTDPYIVNNDGNGDGTFATSGAWNTGTVLSNGNIGYYGTNFVYTSAGTGTKIATFTPSLQTTGYFKVYAYYDSDTDRATNAPYTINYNGGSTTIRVNQQSYGFSWVNLGTFSFTSGTTENIVLTDDANGVVTADAVKLVQDTSIVVDLSWFMQADPLPLKEQY